MLYQQNNIVIQEIKKTCNLHYTEFAKIVEHNLNLKLNCAIIFFMHIFLFDCISSIVLCYLLFTILYPILTCLMFTCESKLEQINLIYDIDVKKAIKVYPKIQNLTIKPYCSYCSLIAIYCI